MPTPGTVASNINPALKQILDTITGVDQNPANQKPATQADVQALATVVADLVALLRPPSAVLLTGADAARAFADLQRGKSKDAPKGNES